MVIDMQKCVGCGICIPYCPVGAISIQEKKGYIDMDKCVECGSCLKQNVCPQHAFVQQTLAWPRYIRAIFSNVAVPSPNTGVPGRGTEEMKTNDVTGRFPSGVVGVAFELGRPGCGTDMKSVQLIATTVVQNGGRLERDNPTTFLFESLVTGKVKPEYMDEHCMSVIVEAVVDTDKFIPLMKEIKKIEPQISTVFSVDVITIMENGKIPTDAMLKEAGFTPRPNGKTCLGLGRPLAKFN
ncbi:hypothetical protein SDC9_100707 [bioreactor metagenome]|uniref:4Fe-4S ferredoxin-type domain-containing protein n=1 Tax=bioreactor metagenome TaxID=1076179 RepID=A0A645AL31_9ZZZZ